LASPVSWNNGDPIYLYKDSSGTIVLTGQTPDIGAYPYGGSGGCTTQRDSNTGSSLPTPIPVGEYSGGIYVAMPFTPTSSYTLCGVTLRMSKVQNPPNMSLYIYSDNSAAPGTQVGTGSQPFNSSSLSTSESDAAFVGLNASLTAGTQYWIVAKDPSGDGTNYTNWYLTNGSASNIFTASPSGSAGSWTTQDSYAIGKFITLSQ
jgi:hypothetical protein